MSSLRVHMIWVGAEPPELIKSCFRSALKVYPGLTVWTDKASEWAKEFPYRLLTDIEARGRELFTEVFTRLDTGTLNSPYTTLADVYRLILLEQFGGLYLDSDTYCANSVEPHLDLNALNLFKERPRSICNGYLYAPHGSEFVKELIALGAAKTSIDKWGSLGPLLVEEFVKSHTINDYKLHPFSLFFPLTYYDICSEASRAKKSGDSVRLSVSPDDVGLHLSHEVLRRAGLARGRSVLMKVGDTEIVLA